MQRWLAIAAAGSAVEELRVTIMPTVTLLGGSNDGELDSQWPITFLRKQLVVGAIGLWGRP